MIHHIYIYTLMYDTTHRSEMRARVLGGFVITLGKLARAFLRSLNYVPLTFRVYGSDIVIARARACENGLRMYSRKRVLATSRDTLRALCNLPYNRVWAGTDPWRSFEAHTIDIRSRGIGYARSALSVLRAVLPRMCSGSCVPEKCFVPDGSYDEWQLLC